ncbi:hypothetical protein BDP55DRAFT_626034 [Colletotrichum godetiae]|uniref:Uncharacterized protein n=1 Tax=Colletotrichum godetiae TaxID=1209918 RepID=A0AAJ0B0P3_9PEZI|nr:uncharacterized protein BDP55DRAFT_626034 [Colletotrichum godetiae]KAK1700459.1 hypothetical protein BDP55DRAFT_626034 [Colletotrichum godetiae]
MRTKPAAASMTGTLAGGISEPALIVAGTKGEEISNPELVELCIDVIMLHRNPCKTCDSRGVVRVPCPHGAAGQAQALSSQPVAEDSNNKPGPRGPTGPTGSGQGVAGAGCH